MILDDELGPVMTADQCTQKLKNLTTWPGTAVYLLSNRNTGDPVYCGTANSKSRLKSHLHKDDLKNGPVGKTMVNPELRNYCLVQPKGWLGVQFKIFNSEDDAKSKEREIIGALGIKKNGGQLFNQRTSG
jgi:hypothetical protein